MTPQTFARRVARVVSVATRKCRPHRWRTPTPGDLMLTCRRCGRTIEIVTAEHWRLNSIVGAVRARQGDAAASSFNRALLAVRRRPVETPAGRCSESQGSVG